MPLDLAHASEVRARRGRRNNLAGVSAEEAVERLYLATGHSAIARRWRGRGGEIDLIFLDADGTYVFVEVKKAGSFDGALARITPRQVVRIHAAAEEFIGTCPKGALSDVRFDAALMDATGQVRILEAALLGY